MSETDNNNPYAAPAANVAREPGAETMGGLIENGRVVDAGRGATWLAEGFKIFMMAPWMWIAITLIYMVISFVGGFIPLLGPLALGLLGSVFIAGMLLGCRGLEQGDPLDVETLFAGFKQNVGQLVLVSVLGLVGLIAIGMVVGVIAVSLGVAGAFTGQMTGGAIALGGIAIAGLVGLALSVPLVMALWFAPALVVFHGQDAVPAVRQSFFGCLKNIVPFLIWGVVAFVLSIVAMIPLGLGFLVLGPVLVGSLYVSYKEIFCA